MLDFIKTAENLIKRGERTKAEEILQDAVSKMPQNWKPFIYSEKSCNAAFWDVFEFRTYAEKVPPETRPADVLLLWVPDSYSKAYYWLGYLAVERGDTEGALSAIEKGLDLEPDHPRLLCEKAFILLHLMRRGDALTLYRKAANARPWVTKLQKADALRGQGEVLIDLANLDEAEDVLKQSLALSLEAEADIEDEELANYEVGKKFSLIDASEPPPVQEDKSHLGSEKAKNELALIEYLRGCKALNPQWTTIVADSTFDIFNRIVQLRLPPEDARERIAPEIYSKLVQAYSDGGWQAFETEFDSVFSPNDSNYQVVKEQVLRDGAFHPLGIVNLRRLLIAFLAGGEDDLEREANYLLGVENYQKVKEVIGEDLKRRARERIDQAPSDIEEPSRGDAISDSEVTPKLNHQKKESTNEIGDEYSEGGSESDDNVIPSQEVRNKRRRTTTIVVFSLLLILTGGHLLLPTYQRWQRKRSIDGKMFDAKVYSPTNRNYYEASVKFEDDKITLFFFDKHFAVGKELVPRGGFLILTLDDTEIRDHRNILATDEKKGVFVYVDVIDPEFPR